jgi:hypothetical protein
MMRPQEVVPGEAQAILDAPKDVIDGDARGILDGPRTTHVCHGCA